MNKARKTLPARTSRGVLNARSAAQNPAGTLVGARRSKPAGLLSAYRLPTSISRPPFASK
ncbi:MAG: hypothetical protein K0R17_2251 [Rariglobus sp.]|jgi:hypothetical protein|nr:hypothetical protein [Microvirga sp.]MDF3058036.1 hypothetical protein [Rariglobus sp.]